MPRKITASAADLATDLLGQTSFWSEGPTRREDEATRVVRRGAVVLGRPAPVRSRALVPALALTVLVLVGGGAWGAWRSVSAYFTVAEVEVPKLVGLPLAEARGAAQRAGIALAAETRAHSATVPVDAIVSQNQPPGKRVKAGRVINVVVSLGREMIAGPDLVGRPVLQSPLGGGGGPGRGR